MDNIEFVILCAGKSTRNYPLTKGISHKSLLPLGSKRIIDHIIGDIIAAGGKNITIVASSERVIDDFKEALSENSEIYEKLNQKNPKIAENLKETFIPSNVNVRYVIQSNPKGTAHALGLAHEISKNSHAVMIFPDDLYFSNGTETHLKRLVDDFKNDDKQILLSGIKMKDVSNVSILENSRLIEKPKNPTSDIGGFSPMIFPKALCDYMSMLSDRIENGEAIEEMGENGECCYVDAINSFLGNSYNRYFIKMFLKDEKTEYMDAGNQISYEKILLKSLLLKSNFKAENQEFLKTFL